MKDWGTRLTVMLVGCIFTLLVLLNTVGGNTVTKAEVSKQISLESPYTKDRSLILHRLEQIERKLDRLLEGQ